MYFNYLPVPPENPSDMERFNLLQYALYQKNRLEDFPNIINLLSPPPDINTIKRPGSCKNIKVGIIGGGLAGLAAAFELRKLGFDIKIFEAATDHIGGRVYTYHFNKAKGLYGELGAMRVPISHETSWHYLNLFKINTSPFIQENPNAYIYVRNRRTLNNDKSIMEKIYPKFNLTPAERMTPYSIMIEKGLNPPLYGMSPLIRREILKVKREYHLSIDYWSSFNEREILEKMNLSQGAIDMISSVTPFIGSFLYNSYSENLQEEYPANFSYVYEVPGGMEKLPQAFYNSLLSEEPKEYKNLSLNDLGKVTWKNGAWVRGIYKANNEVILEYKDKDCGEYKKENFDYVVCAIPFATLRNVKINPLFSNRKMQAIREVNYDASQKTIFLCKERFWEKQGIVGGGSFTDLPIRTIWYPTNRNWQSKKGVIISSYNFTLDATRLGNLSNDARIEQIKRQVEQVHGLENLYLDDIVEDYKTINYSNEPNFLGGFCYYFPQQKKLFSYASKTPEYNNRVFFAGEHTSSTHSWMQSALKSGMVAANYLARNCDTFNFI